MQTDRADYVPGKTVIIAGNGFQAVETVQLVITNLTDPTVTGAEFAPWTVTADDSGNFTTTWTVTSNELGMTLQLTATGVTSGLVAQTTFTDAGYNWLGGAAGAPNDWNTAANWNPASVPTSSDSVTFQNGKTYYPILTSGQSFTVKGFTLMGSASITINSNASLSITGPISIAGTVNTSGTVDFNGGNVTGAGTFNISGGTVSCGNFQNNLPMSGGTLQSSGSFAPSSFSATGGTVALTGNNPTIPAFTYWNLQINGPANSVAKLNGNITIQGNLSIAAGNKLNFNAKTATANTLTLGGVTQTAGTYNQNNNSTYFIGTTNITVSAGSAAKLAFTTQPANTTAGVALASVVVQLQDASGNNVKSSGVAVTVSLNGGSFTSGTTRINSDFTGKAAFSDLVINLAGSYTLTAAATGLTSTNSTSFNITAAVASKLVFTTPPVTSSIGVASSVITVQRQDQFGNPNATDAAITVNLTSSSAGGSFSNATGTAAITSTNILNGSSTASFLYRDTLAGNPTITNAATGLIGAIQTETITKAASTITLTGSNFTYSGASRSPTIAFTGSTGLRTTNYVGTSVSYFSFSAPTNAGIYYVSNTVAADANYSGTTNTLAFTINQAVTSIVLTSSAPTNGYRDSVFFTATLTATATGAIQFKTNNVAFGTAMALSAGAANSLSTTNLPRGSNFITAEYAGTGNYLGNTNSIWQIVTNHPPAAATANYVRTAGLRLRIFWSDLATNWSDMDGDSITNFEINLTTTNSVTLSTNSLQILYSSSAPNTNDRFSYIIRDSYGDTNIAYVNVVVDPFVTGQTITHLPTNPNALTYFGHPGYTYLLQRSTNVLNPNAWVNISTNTIGSSGQVNVVDKFCDLGFTPAQAYYRVGWKPSY